MVKKKPFLVAQKSETNGKQRRFQREKYYLLLFMYRYIIYIFFKSLKFPGQLKLLSVVIE